MITGATYGLSFSDHPTWMYGKPELMITVQSDSIEWARAAANMAFQLRGSCPFAYGNTIRYGKPIAEDSEMDAFFIFAPSILNKEDYLHIDLGLDYKICTAGLYPIYSSEIELINTWGLKDFWHHPEFDIYNIKRKPITG
ncbi:suppressor of fused domain protein [Fulvivirga maritima]|nr:suppressor of fused domain protein [Fulvivirga maritima]UII26704.1 suppressor of fused domain protein [Fulvivirga maritima]